jgi:hypothetical protein
MINIFNLKLFNLFTSKHIKIYPTEYVGNRRRSKTEYNIENYKDTLKVDFINKMENKRHNNNNISLRIRGNSF